MQCGHAANAVTDDWKPLCAICAGVDPRSERIAEEPDLAGRMARCSVCKRELRSAEAFLWYTFFEHRPDEDFDSFYCGCYFDLLRRRCRYQN